MSRKNKIWLFILLTPVVLLYFFSPPRNLTIQIDAKPQGVQEFYVEITSARNNLHGMTVKSIAKSLVPANKKTKVSLNRKKILWFGRVTARIYHPEYFRETGNTSNNYLLPSAVFSPTTWQNILSTEEKLVNQQVYRADVLAYRDLPMSHLNYHLWFVNENIIDLYLENNSKVEIRKSLDVLTSISEQFIEGMLEENLGEYGETKEMKDEIEKAYNLTNEIYEKIN